MTLPIKEEFVTRVLHYLEILNTKRLENASVQWRVDDPSKFQRQLRDGIFAAAQHAKYHHLKDLAAVYKIRVKGQFVICEPRVALVVVQEEKPTTKAIRQFPEVRTIEQCVGALSLEKIADGHFPSLVPSDEKLKLLYLYCSKNGYFIINHEEAGLTITRTESELVWHPTITKE